MYLCNMKWIPKLNSEGSFTNKLPADLITVNKPRQVIGVAYSSTTPARFNKPRLVHVSDMAATLDIPAVYLQTNDFLELITGQEILDNATPYAMAYAGHQFGNWAGQLGDGRAINLFETVHDNTNWAWQLKGAGPTPYSRQGDGFAVLRSSIREHLCSEAMHYLGVPTTRSLSLTLSGEQVLRDVLYDGNAAYEKGAIVCRVAPSFIRFGNFELAAAQGENVLLKQLTDYTITTFYKHITTSGKEAYLQFFQEVADRTRDMILHWQRVGFVHGVMNTDNMSILGLTIDYGPYGWLEPYDHNWTPNTTDKQHSRYRYGAQAEIGLWNLLQLANALFSLIEDAPALEDILANYKTSYQEKYLTMMRSKLGLSTAQPNDGELITFLEHNLQLHEMDMTIFFREISDISSNTLPTEAFAIISIALYDLENLSEPHQWSWLDWIDSYLARLKQDMNQLGGENDAFKKARSQQMNSINPKYVLRNYMAQLAIDAANEGDYGLITELHELIKKPYDEQPEHEKWYELRPDWARDKVGCSMLSCSS
jgi:uncharacterized protein YdiU (UPF0061 family)